MQIGDTFSLRINKFRADSKSELKVTDMILGLDEKVMTDRFKYRIIIGLKYRIIEPVYDNNCLESIDHEIIAAFETGDSDEHIYWINNNGESKVLAFMEIDKVMDSKLLDEWGIKGLFTKPVSFLDKDSMVMFVSHENSYNRKYLVCDNDVYSVKANVDNLNVNIDLNENMYIFNEDGEKLSVNHNRVAYEDIFLAKKEEEVA